MYSKQTMAHWIDGIARSKVDDTSLVKVELQWVMDVSLAVDPCGSYGNILARPCNLSVFKPTIHAAEWPTKFFDIE